MIFGYKIVMKSQGRTAMTADLHTGKDLIDQEEREFLAWKAEKLEKRPGSWFYRTFVAWLF